MSFPNHRDEPRSSRRGRRLQRRGSSTSSGRRETSASDENRGPSRANYTEERVESWRESDTSYDPRVRRVTSLPPDPRRPRAPLEFQYEPLKEGGIRILRLLPGKPRERVRCELDDMSLRRPQPYIALSYAWGDKYDKVDMELNRGIFKVTKSLYGALEAVREPDHDVLVWADAVCINQDDDEERSKQVQEMYRIYQQAHLVGIWLGPEANDSPRAIALIDRLTAEFLDKEEIKRIIYSPSWDRHFDALVDLFERDYWDRLWVVQEVNLAKRAIVYCGDNKTAWDRFTEVSPVLRSCEDDLSYRFKRRSRRYRHSYTSQLINCGPRDLEYESDLPFDVQLSRYRPSLAENPRDKLYGLLGLLPSQIQEVFKPNYESSPIKLYIDIVEYYLQTTGSLNIICHAHCLRPGPSSLNLPSWVPDWSDTFSYVPLGDHTIYKQRFSFCASGSAEGEVQLLGETRRKLQMEAIYISSMRIVGVPLGKFLDHHAILIALFDWWNIFKRLSDKNDESFYRTITLGQINYQGWVSIFRHVIGMEAAHDGAGLLSHTDFPINPSIRIDPDNAETIFHTEVRESLENQQFFVTENYDIGLARGVFKCGCVICIPLGCNTPVVLEPDGSDGEYRFLSDAYVDGFMYGEAVELWKRGHLKSQMYTLH